MSLLESGVSNGAVSHPALFEKKSAIFEGNPLSLEDLAVWVPRGLPADVEQWQRRGLCVRAGVP